MLYLKLLIALSFHVMLQARPLYWHEKGLIDSFSPSCFQNLKNRIDALEKTGVNIQETYNLVKIVIQKNKPTFYPAAKIELDWVVYKNYKKAIETVCKAHIIADCVLFLNLDDAVTQYDAIHQLNLPVLVSSKMIGYDEQIPIPDWEALRGYKDIAPKKIAMELIDDLYKAHPFKSRKPIAFWRGVNSGGEGAQEPSWPQSKRGSVVYLSQNSKRRLIDAKFSKFYSPHPDLRDFMAQSRYVSDPVSLEDQFNYQFLIDIDGHGCTYSRLYWILGSGALCLKQTSNLIQWYYPGLEDGENLIYFQRDGSDLEDLLAYFIKHPDEAQMIANSARDFFHSYLNPIFQTAYLTRVLKIYAELYNGRFEALSMIGSKK